MFKKINAKIKNGIKNWLGISALTKDVAALDGRLQSYKESNNSYTKYLKEEIVNNSEEISSMRRTLENVIHIGTDIRNEYDGHSWAVICIEGKMNIIKFINLNRKDARYIFDFLKSYEAGRHCIDAPCSQMFYDGLFKF